MLACAVRSNMGPGMLQSTRDTCCRYGYELPTAQSSIRVGQDASQLTQHVLHTTDWFCRPHELQRLLHLLQQMLEPQLWMLR